MQIIEITNTDKRYDDKQVFRGLSASFEKGDTTIIFGPSGCGKTTLLRLIAGFEKPDSGEIIIGGTIATSPQILVPPRNRGINMVFQNLALWPHMTVVEHLNFIYRSEKIPRGLYKERIHKIISLVDLNGHEKKYPSQLSGGEQQRLAIARALVIEKPILLLDEPLSHIHFELKKEILHLIKKIKLENEITMIYVTHNADEAHYIGDKVYCFKDGTLQEEYP